ncbi:hypothetical protein BKA65DRAFT_589260 [Rhexocercosporidium sp. MPI-PUGE-AT-0058]|nr:hypothetical protein BKA65DRAFT_589260 [Rhexocercosporidium sp. MPI-PUGE-AT-0058]
MSERKIMIDLRQLSAKCKLYQSKIDASRGSKPHGSGSSFNGSRGGNTMRPEDLGSGSEKLGITSKKPRATLTWKPSSSYNSGASAPSTNEAHFKVFPKLPAELRLEVIKESISTANTREHKRVVEVLYFDICGGKIGDDGWPWYRSDHKYSINSKTSALLQVDEDFRFEALKTWSASINGPNGNSYARFDPENTTIYISYSELSERACDDTMDVYSDMLTRDICQKIKHLAIDFCIWECHTWVKNPIQKFTALEDFTFVVHDAACMPDWNPDNKPTEFKLVSVNEDDMEEVRPDIRLWEDINHLIKLCTEFKAENPEYSVPVIKTAVMYCGGKACCNSVESVAAHWLDVLAPGGGRPRRS